MSFHPWFSAERMNFLKVLISTETMFLGILTLLAIQGKKNKTKR